MNSQTKYESDLYRLYRVAVDVAGRIRGRVIPNVVRTTLNILHDDPHDSYSFIHAWRGFQGGWYLLGHSIHLESEHAELSLCCGVTGLLISRVFTETGFPQFFELPSNKQADVLSTWADDVAKSLDAGSVPPAFLAGVIGDCHARRLLDVPPTLADTDRENGVPVPIQYCDADIENGNPVWRFQCTACGAIHSHLPGENIHANLCRLYTPLSRRCLLRLIDASPN